MKKKGRPLGSLMKRRRKGPVSAMRLALGEEADRMGLFFVVGSRPVAPRGEYTGGGQCLG